MRWLNEALGACTLGPLKRPISAWSGVYRVQCERGPAELTLSLTSASTPKIASVSVRWIDGTPTAAVQEAAVAAARLLEQFDEATPSRVCSMAPAHRRALRRDSSCSSADAHLGATRSASCGLVTRSDPNSQGLVPFVTNWRSWPQPGRPV